MLKILYRNCIFYVVTTIVVVGVFALGFLFGKYGKSAPSLEVAENHSTSMVTGVHKEDVPVREPIQDEQIQDEPAIEDVTTDMEPTDDVMTVRATAYCPCESCSEGYGRMTATGVLAEEGRTIAVDPKVIPYGSEVIIDGHTYIAEDCGGAIKGEEIDIFFESHEDVSNFGVQWLDVVVKKG